MSCSRPLTASFDSSGKITFSARKFEKGLVPFQLPCSKCVACRLDRAKKKAIRVYHEAQMSESAIFLTLTYSDEHVGDGRLRYRDWQLFMKKLRKRSVERISFMVTGEYGEITKRPHWHAIVFNYYPSDARRLRTTERGDDVWFSESLDALWGNGFTEFGSVTLESANYVARYAAKKLVHGPDKSHNLHPVHRTSCKHAIGKKWIETYWKSVFEKGFVVLPGGVKAGIPRYYEDWLKKNQPGAWRQYLVQAKQETIDRVLAFKNQEQLAYQIYRENRRHDWELYINSLPGPEHMRDYVTNIRFNQLQERLKL